MLEQFARQFPASSHVAEARELAARMRLQDVLDRANAALERRDMAAAATLVREARRLSPESPEVQGLHARWLDAVLREGLANARREVDRELAIAAHARRDMALWGRVAGGAARGRVASAESSLAAACGRMRAAIANLGALTGQASAEPRADVERLQRAVDRACPEEAR
ncbi:MAG: hypothetical protein OHK0013_13420 [Sandaracinaceae bacterium]